MPRSGPTLCRHASCYTPVGRRGYCDVHKHLATRYAKGTRQERGYGVTWQRKREAVLRRDQGWCQPCLRRNRLTSASEVDHIVPKAWGGTDDPDNLQSICNPCHKHKTAREGGGARG